MEPEKSIAPPHLVEDCDKAVAPGVRRCRWYHGYRLYGHIDNLLTAGLAKPEWFPDGKTVRLKSDGTPRLRNGKPTIARTKDNTVNGRLVQGFVTPLGHACVFVHYTPEEEKAIEAQEAEGQTRRSQERERQYAERQAERYRKLLAEPGALHEQLKEDLQRYLSMIAIGVFNYDNDPDRPWRFPKEVWEEVRDAGCRMIEALEKNSPRPMAGAIVAGDKSFQRFLRRATGGDHHA